jgi:N utilization substance protein B
MINRILLRIKVIQILYSYYKGDNQGIEKAEAELFFSIEKAYDLYFYLLLLVDELTTYAKDRIDKKRQAFTANFKDKNPSVIFVKNRFASQLAMNKELQLRAEKQKISWSNHKELIKALYEEIINSEIYAKYMESGENSYQKDKEVWRMIFKKIFPVNETLDNELEDISIYWNDDTEIVLSFILKTIKLFEEDNGENQPLLGMFKDDEDRDFVRELFRNAIYNEAEYRNLIQEQSKNWEIDRLAFMDSIIMQAALSEICSFPSIPINVTINEYIEISKYYSTDKSSIFINGILDSIVGKLRKDNKIIKAAYYTPNTK